MKVLVVTGRLAEDLVKKSAREADVIVLDVDIAAFITPKMLLEAAPNCYDLILIPGAITTDFGDVERALKTKIRLGPKHASDLGFVLSHLDKVELSSSTPACVLLEDMMRKDALTIIKRLEIEAVPALDIKKVKIGGNSRMKVLAEIVDATKLDTEELDKKISYYEEQGADMIDLGLPLDARPSQVTATLRAARRATDMPLSVDTVLPDLIGAGIEAGADLILSLNGEILPHVGEIVAAADVPVVIIPGPGGIELEENFRIAKDLGIRAIADPVLDPPLLGLAASLAKYKCFNEAHPEVPLFFGVGNVTELLDADSQGANALLAALGAEVGSSILFTPEYSPKAKGSIRELRIASQMMLLATERKTPPKDLGIDLLVLKEKRHRPEEKISEPFVEASTAHKFELDQAGSFKITLTSGKIFARQERTTVAGTSARDILNTLIDMGLISRLEHAGYLGRELQKAELALRLGRSYSQDEPFISEKS